MTIKYLLLYSKKNMIIPSMSLEEICREIKKDAPILFRKMGYVTHDLQKKLSKHEIKTGSVKFFDYLSKYRNNWIYRISIDSKKTHNSAMLVYHNGRGHAGIVATPELNIIYHTGHFFNRFNERCRLGLTSFNDIVKKYMDQTFIIQFQELEEIKPGIFTIFSIISSGAVLGVYNKNLGFVKANTFLTNEMLFQNQKDMKAELTKTLEKYKDSIYDLI